LPPLNPTRCTLVQIEAPPPKSVGLRNGEQAVLHAAHFLLGPGNWVRRGGSMPAKALIQNVIRKLRVGCEPPYARREAYYVKLRSEGVGFEPTVILRRMTRRCVQPRSFRDRHSHHRRLRFRSVHICGQER